MTVLNLRPVGWNGMTPKQWGSLREMIRQVYKCSIISGNLSLMMRAQFFLTETEGRDV